MTRIDLLMIGKKLEKDWTWICPYPDCDIVSMKPKKLVRHTIAKHTGRKHIRRFHGDMDIDPIMIRMYKTVVMNGV